MTSIAELVSAAGGVLRKRDLVALGATDRRLTHAVRSGSVRRPRRGWYSTLSPADRRFQAVRIGGRLSGAAALFECGAWLQRRPPLTVSVPANASRLRPRRRARVVWDGRDICDRGSLTSVDPRDALVRAICELDFLDAVAVVDWALHTGLIELDDLPRLLAHLPRDAQRIIGWVDPKTQSILESLVRTRERLRGNQVEIQCRLSNGQLLDLLINGIVGLETDGREFHESSFEVDRRKDCVIIGDGYLPLRASASMVLRDADRLSRAIETLLTIHNDPPPSRPDILDLARPLPGRGRRPWRLGRVPCRADRTRFPCPA
ncbi:type IV toxin-antitoxin system AbiEi family antitoxin domain-containing protein [Frigoribacterium sp. 2-23]|uniref:type IV toxin-antitoxin system AbiEi family antitoxin domain-containing protein n=1 Tax=Frigoribacterium sp. 2-23 TaxID=3415006 RepID=UPI003C6F2267